VLQTVVVRLQAEIGNGGRKPEPIENWERFEGEDGRGRVELVLPAVDQGAGPRARPDQLVSEPKLLDESCRRRIGTKKVVIKLFEERRPELETGRKTTRLRLTLEEQDVLSALREPQGDRQPERPAPQDAVAGQEVLEALESNCLTISRSKIDHARCVGRSLVTQAHRIEVAVDRALCIGNGVCVALAPHAFSLDESMKAIVLDPSAESPDALEAAARQCPTQAIYLSEDGEPLYP
jgi:ferredoxin